VNLPKIFAERPTDVGTDVLSSSSFAVLGAFVAEGLIAGTELVYGYEDLPNYDELAGLLSEAVRFWHQEFQLATDFAVLQRGFVHAYLLGLDGAVQIHKQEGDGLRIPTSLAGILDGKRRAEVRAPLEALAKDSMEKIENVFVLYQDQILSPVASTRNQAMLYDFYAGGCLWAALAGVDAGLAALEPVE